MNSRAYIGSNTLYAIRHEAVGALMAFAMFFQAGVPLLYNLAPPQARGLMQITICSGGFAKVVTVDENGKPVKEAPASSKYSGNSCVHHCGGGLLCYASTTTAMPFLLWVMVASSASHLLDELTVAHLHARGPPV